MSLEDPFVVVKDEVTKALNRTRGLFQLWQQQQQQAVTFSKDDINKTATDLKNSIRSIEWDLEDLEDTIAIVEKNPARFRLTNLEVSQRRCFVQQTREKVKNIKSKIQGMRGQDFDHSSRKPLLENTSPVRSAPKNSNSGYVRLPIEGDQDYGDDDDREVHNAMKQQSSLVKQQDDQLVLISGSVGTLKSMSRRIGSELDEQALILDDMGHEMETAENKMDSTLKKMAKVLRMSNDRRQWIAIGVLTGLMIIIIILFYVL